MHPWSPFSKGSCCDIEMADGFFIQNEVLQKAKNTYLLSKLDVSDEENLRLKTDVKLTTSGAEMLKKAPTNLHQGLKNSWLKFLKAMVVKIQERSPISYKLVRVACALDPLKMATNNSENMQNLCDAIVAVMYQYKRISAKQGDAAKEQ